MVIDPNDDTLTVKNKSMVLALRGTRFNGTIAQSMTGQSGDEVKRWFADAGAALVRARIISLTPASNGYSIEKFLVPEEAGAKAEFLSFLNAETKLTEHEYNDSLVAPPPKRLRLPTEPIHAASAFGPAAAVAPSIFGSSQKTFNPMFQVHGCCAPPDYAFLQVPAAPVLTASTGGSLPSTASAAQFAGACLSAGFQAPPAHWPMGHLAGVPPLDPGAPHPPTSDSGAAAASKARLSPY